MGVISVDNIIQEASNDIRIIREVLERTSRSLRSFGKIFLLWGVSFFFISAINIIYFNKFLTIENISSLNITLYSLVTLTFLLIIPILSYIKVSKSNPLNGLEKQIMKIWIGILCLNILSNLVPTSIIIDNVQYVKRSVVFSYISPITVFTYALGLFVVSLLTTYKQPKWIALLYVVVGAISLNGTGSLLSSVNLVVFPGTFIYLGLYLNTFNNRDGGIIECK